MKVYKHGLLCVQWFNHSDLFRSRVRFDCAWINPFDADATDYNCYKSSNAHLLILPCHAGGVCIATARPLDVRPMKP